MGAQTELCKLLQGTWAGERSSSELTGEHVKSVWEPALDGSFLRESWFTSGTKGVLGLNATAFFRVRDGSPAEFFVVYKGGRMAMGKSEIRGREWRLLHEWFGQSPELNEIRIRFEGDDRYLQEVRKLEQQGKVVKLVNRTILVRQRESGISRMT